MLDGDDVTHVDPVQLRRRTGYVIQQVGLFPHQRVWENVATVPSLLGWDKARRRSRADELLELVGLDPAVYRDRWPAQLSGGQRQRVGVARALAADPPVLLMDEPFSAIDPIARDRLQSEFLRVQEQVRKTILFVTHDVDEAVRLGDRIAVFRQGGVLEQYDTPAAVLGAPGVPVRRRLRRGRPRRCGGWPSPASTPPSSTSRPSSRSTTTCPPPARPWPAPAPASRWCSTSTGGCAATSPPTGSTATAPSPTGCAACPRRCPPTPRSRRRWASCCSTTRAGWRSSSRAPTATSACSTPSVAARGPAPLGRGRGRGARAGAGVTGTDLPARVR